MVSAGEEQLRSAAGREGAPIRTPKSALQPTAIQEQSKLLHLPAVGSQCAGLAELAVKEKQSHLDYLEALLAAELEEREHRMVNRRLRQARLPLPVLVLRSS